LTIFIGYLSKAVSLFLIYAIKMPTLVLMQQSSLNFICLPTRTTRNQTGLKIKKLDHESLDVVLFRAFNLSCFSDCVSEFSARKNTDFRTKKLKGRP